MNTVQVNSTVIIAKWCSISLIPSTFVSWSMGKCSFLFSLHSVTLVFIYISMDSHFSQWVVICYCYYLFWCLNLQIWSVDIYLRWFLYSSPISSSFLEHFLLPSTTKYFGLILYSPWIRGQSPWEARYWEYMAEVMLSPVGSRWQLDNMAVVDWRGSGALKRW